MNEELKSILTWVGTVGVLGYWAFAIYKHWELNRFQKAIPSLTNEELIHTFESKGIILSAGVLPELEKRKVDMSFALPQLIDAATNNNIAMRILGWSSIEKYFPEIKESIDYNSTRPSKEDKATLVGIKNEHIKSLRTTSASRRV